MGSGIDVKVVNGEVDLDDLVQKINKADEQGKLDDPLPSDIEGVVAELREKQMIKDAMSAKRYSDAFANHAARTGWGEDNLINATEYPLTRLTQDWQLLTSLYRSSWIVQRVCNVIPEDALADLSIEAPDLSTDDLHLINDTLRHTDLRQSILRGLRWGRLYGGAAGIIMVSGQEDDMSTPLDIEAVTQGSFRGLYIVDRWSGIYPSYQLVENEKDPDYGLPEYYEVRDECYGGGSFHVHHSRVLRFTGIEMPYWEQIAEQYWGTSAIEAIYDELIKHDNVAHNIANLTFKANLSVLQVENLDQMFATSSTTHQRRMYAMLSAINVLENSMGIRLVNKGDDIQQLQYSFSGLPEVMDSAMMDMAGATAIPVTRLFGRSPAGMNSTGESDEKMYRQTLEQERSVHITPVLQKILPVFCRSALGRMPEGAEFKYPPLIELSMNDKADIVDRQSQAVERLFQANLIPGNAVLESFRNSQIALDLTSPITDEQIEHVKDKYMNDLQQPQGDPFGGAMQGAAEAGVPAQEDPNDIKATPEGELEKVDGTEIPEEDLEEGLKQLPPDEQKKQIEIINGMKQKAQQEGRKVGMVEYAMQQQQGQQTAQQQSQPQEQPQQDDSDYIDEFDPFLTDNALRYRRRGHSKRRGRRRLFASI